MTDDKSVEAQSHELQKIARKISSKGMTLDEQFQVVVIIDKLTLDEQIFLLYNKKQKTLSFTQLKICKKKTILESGIAHYSMS